MKKSITYILCISSFLFHSCSSEKKEETLDWKVYKNAKANGDYISCISALNRIMARDEYNMGVYDSLARVYYQAQLFVPAYQVAQKALQQSNNDDLVLIAAESSERIGKTPESIDYYLQWLQNHPNEINISYKVATAYFNIKNIPAAKGELAKIIKNPKAKEIGLNFNTDNVAQTISYYAAALNVLGFIQMQEKDFIKAEIAFLEALKVHPNFVLAKNNYAALKQQLKK